MAGTPIPAPFPVADEQALKARMDAERDEAIRTELTRIEMAVSEVMEVEIDAMHAAWRERCPIYLALLNPNEVTLTIA